MTANTNLLSGHARSRIQQRGIRTTVLDLVIANADVALHAGDGCETIRVSRTAVREMIESGTVDPQDGARASRIAVVLGRRGVVTALHPSRGRRGRPYRRQGETRAARIRRSRR